VARCIHEQSHHADVHRIREGVCSLPDRRNAFRHRFVPEQVRYGGLETGILLLPHVRRYAHVHQRELLARSFNGPQPRGDQVLGWPYPGTGDRGLSREMYRRKESQHTCGKDRISGCVNVHILVRGSERFHGQRDI
jgi:hypothetical protein